MKITNSGEIPDPLETESGEIIYELFGIGRGQELAVNHSLARVVIPPGKSSSTHYHQQAHESYFILQGQGSMTVNGDRFTLTPGDACYLEPGDLHHIHSSGEVDLVFLAACVPPWSPEDSIEVPN
jgi:mannose-6-phosphate isomerase-like protein (cupin superfamily)